MKLIKVDKLSGYAALVAGILSLTTATQAAIVAPNTLEIPGVALGGGTNLGADPTLAGAVIADQTINFASNPAGAFTGSLRSLVVRRTDNSQLDFYYQLANTTPNIPVGAGADIFRLTLGGFDGWGTNPGDGLTVNYRTDGLAGISGAGATVNGTKSAFSSDRDPGIPGKGVGFDFDSSHFVNLNPGGATTAPGNVEPGQTSNFLLIRTKATSTTAFPGFANIPRSAVVSGAGTSLVSAFTPIPEPATALMGLALSSFIGCTHFGRSRRRKA
jgi:hypothetical protein